MEARGMKTPGAKEVLPQQPRSPGPGRELPPAIRQRQQTLETWTHHRTSEQPSCAMTVLLKASPSALRDTYISCSSSACQCIWQRIYYKKEGFSAHVRPTWDLTCVISLAFVLAGRCSSAATIVLRRWSRRCCSLVQNRSCVCCQRKITSVYSEKASEPQFHMRISPHLASREGSNADVQVCQTPPPAFSRTS